jgi:hypothetical protein
MYAYVHILCWQSVAVPATGVQQKCVIPVSCPVLKVLPSRHLGSHTHAYIVAGNTLRNIYHTPQLSCVYTWISKHTTSP